ncbi:hypothetical protein Pla123a_41100 [Posidoniimonas polymericola]|uniref:DUF4252 domain-containing protein n=1 Tax=Posidoniimonas polymericola TaxID=2528002 RepID=A0A5C5YBP3_9BACT|nr:DUF4252 domain-containing protein [Posidoniimonas polymericola]TWT72810.1 hypothetical protein Pla123a_41100 [Posidoniimonas polymericola]
MWDVRERRGIFRHAALASALLIAPAATLQPHAALAAGQTTRLELPGVPTPTVEVDLGGQLIDHALSLGEAALTGFLNGLQDNALEQNAEAVRFATEQIGSTKELTQTLREVVRGVHLRVWKELPDVEAVAASVAERLETELPDQGWEPTLRASESGKMVRVYVRSTEDAVEGVLILAHTDHELALVNLAGDLSQENVQRLSTLATKIAVELGLDRELEKAVQRLQQKRGN